MINPGINVKNVFLATIILFFWTQIVSAAILLIIMLTNLESRIFNSIIASMRVALVKHFLIKRNPLYNKFLIHFHSPRHIFINRLQPCFLPNIGWLVLNDRWVNNIHPIYLLLSVLTPHVRHHIIIRLTGDLKNRLKDAPSNRTVQNLSPSDNPSCLTNRHFI